MSDNTRVNTPKQNSEHENDRNFDDISGKFSKNIYGTTKGQIREAVIWRDLEEVLISFPKGQSLRILDIGGGQGQIACRLAQLGHRVTLCDISANMLEVAQQNALKHHVELSLIHCSAQNISAYINEPVDLIVCHAMLEWVEQQKELLQILHSHLKPNGVLSLMFYNYYGLFFKTVTLGNFGYVKAGLSKRKKKTLSPDYPLKPEDVENWLQHLNMSLLQKTGVRIFHDYMINKAKQQSAFAELLELELMYCRQAPYLGLARYIHFIARKSQ